MAVTGAAPLLSSAAKRALKERDELKKLNSVAFEAGPALESKPLYWEAIVRGPKGTPYEGGTFCLEIDLSEGYPFKPPWLSFQTPIYHCNLALVVSPRRCSAEFLMRWHEDHWHPKMDIRSVLQRIVDLMERPIPKLEFQPPPRGEPEDGQPERTRLDNCLVHRDMAELLVSDKPRYLELARASTLQYAALAAVELAVKSDIKASSRSSSSSSGGAAAAAAVHTSISRAAGSAASANDSSARTAAVEDSEGEEDVELPCPLCGTWYSNSVLAMHLQGHFAFEASLWAVPHVPQLAEHDTGGAACSCAAVNLEDEDGDWVDAPDAASTSPASSSPAAIAIAALPASAAELEGGFVDTDAELAVRLQREELEKTLAGFEQLASDRMSALRLQAQEQREERRAREALEQLQAQAAPASGAAAAAAVPAVAPTTQAKPKLVRPRPAPAPAPPPAVSRKPGTNEAKVLSFASERDNEKLATGSGEFKAVEAYFSSTLGARSVTIHSIESVSGGGRAKFRPGTERRIMFHGCKCLANETRIVATGFQVSSCVSGGANYGTWFAYNAAYSDSGFAFNDASGIRHMFVCVVSNAHVVMDTNAMRVVGQHCAYPRWIVKYTHVNSASQQTFNVGAYGRWGPARSAQGGASASAPNLGHEVRDGQWVPIAIPPTRR